MTAKDFDPEKFAKSMKSQATEQVPSDLNNEQKELVLDLVYKSSMLSGNVLVKNKSFSLDEEQASTITQFAAEWTFHKTIDLLRAKVRRDLYASILQDVCFCIYKKAKYLLLNNIDLCRIIPAVEDVVSLSFEKSLRELAKNGKIKEEDIPNILKQSNIDAMAEQAERTKNKNPK